MCRKDLILESGNPVTLPLYPGDCKISATDQADDRLEDIENNISNETSEVEKQEHINRTGKPISSVRDAMKFFNIPWRNDKENDVIEEAESSRAFNTRTTKINSNTSDVTLKEIVEPILKPHSTKNARSHDPNKEKSEITEPILGPTTARNVRGMDKETVIHESNRKEVYVRDSKQSGSEWVPKEIPVNIETERKVSSEEEQERKSQGNPFEQIVTTVQFIPNRLARMFEQAEKYARETILPLVSTYTPTFISDIISPKEEKKYVPLKYQASTLEEIEVSNKKVSEARSLKNISISPPVINNSNEATTPYSHIQKIKKKLEQSNSKEEVLQGSASSYVSAVTRNTTPKMNKSVKFQDETARTVKEKDENVSSTVTTNKNAKAIYINLPVFDENDKKVKYIPLNN